MHSIRRYTAVAVVVCAAFGLTALACSDDEARSAPKPPDSCEAPQGDITLRPAGAGATRTRGFAASAQPGIRVDLGGVTDAQAVEVTLSECGGRATATRTFEGTAGFEALSRDNWSLDGWSASSAADVLLASCIVVSAVATDAGSVVGAEYVALHRGNYTIRGQATLPPGLEPALTRVDVLIDVGSTTRRADVEADGSFLVPNVAPGLVKSVRASVRIGSELLLGSSHPLVELDAKSTSADVAVTLAPTIPARDEHEPDDTATAVATRPPLALRTPESHSLPSKQDVDVIPFEITSGYGYRVDLTPDSTAEGDFRLALLDASGGVLLEKNASPGDFSASPSLSWKATFTGRALVRVTRNDDGAATARYSIELDITSIY